MGVIVRRTNRPRPADPDQRREQQRDSPRRRKRAHASETNSSSASMSITGCSGRCAVRARSPPATGRRCHALEWRDRTSGSPGSGLGIACPGAVQYSQTSWRGYRAPLLLELERPLVRRRAAEVERGASVGRSPTGSCASTAARWAQRVELAERRCPRNLDRGARASARWMPRRDAPRGGRRTHACGLGTPTAPRERSCMPYTGVPRSRMLCAKTVVERRRAARRRPPQPSSPLFSALRTWLRSFRSSACHCSLGRALPATAPSRPCGAVRASSGNICWP